MPTVLIEVRKKYSPEQEVALMDAVHNALREAFKILPDDNITRLIAHEPHRFTCPSKCEHPELFTHISIDCFIGRSLEAKRDLYRAIVKNLVEIGIPGDHIKILLREASKENWGIRGGQAACDVEFDFKIEI